jgi:hypothetical protein
VTEQELPAIGNLVTLPKDTSLPSGPSAPETRWSVNDHADQELDGAVAHGVVAVEELQTGEIRPPAICRHRGAMGDASSEHKDKGVVCLNHEAKPLHVADASLERGLHEKAATTDVQQGDRKIRALNFALDSTPNGESRVTTRVRDGRTNDRALRIDSHLHRYRPLIDQDVVRRRLTDSELAVTNHASLSHRIELAGTIGAFTGSRSVA